MKNIKKIFCNSWVKSLFILLCCFLGTYYTIYYFSDNLIALFNWKNKEFWTTVAVMIPAIFLFPTLVNGFFFLKIIQIADNTKKTQDLLKKQNELLAKFLENSTNKRL
ncbi:MAG: hypothetical protein ACRCWI_06365 [Brevinema sp.]